MFKFSAEPHIWKKYTQKLNAWDLSLNDMTQVMKIALHVSDLTY